MTVSPEVSGRKSRKFVAEDFEVTNWDNLVPYFQQLLESPLDNALEIESWLKNSSELEAVLDEDRAWRYIKMTCNTTDEAIKQHYEQFISEILPQWSIMRVGLIGQKYLN